MERVKVAVRYNGRREKVPANSDAAVLGKPVWLGRMKSTR